MHSIDFVNRANAEYIEQLFQQYQRDPRSVPENWQAFFSGFELGMARSVSGLSLLNDGARPTDQPVTIGVFDLVHSYRELGHFSANLDPLGLVQRPLHPLLHLSNFGLNDVDLDRQVGPASFQGATDGSLRDLIEKLRLTYCGSLGVEFTGIDNKTQREWLQQNMEPIYNRPQFSPEETRNLAAQLVAAEEFEHFLARAFIGEKRFGAEGAEAMVPLLNTIVELGAAQGGEQFILNMAHRGRLNTLVHVLHKPYETMLSVFMKTALPTADVTGDGDVKYHLGYANTRVMGGHKVKISLIPNPSHLEMINPVHQGIVRCKQDMFGDVGRERVVPIAIHGDAAFTGQGVVAETLNLSELPGFRTGGTIHIIVNNQVGFTTPPSQERFTPYCTDLAKAIQAPIFHVNGDDPEAVVWAGKMAIGFRQKFKCDVIIDLWCYRRNGHNETDEPTFTQPVMYRRIAEHPSVRKLYESKLLAEGRITQPELDQMKEEVLGKLNAARELAKEARPRHKVPSFRGVWKGLSRAGADWSADTKLPREKLASVIAVYDHPPEGFTIHPKVLKGVIEKRQEMLQTGKAIDWGCAEMLAMGTLLGEGFGVRLTGQDVERGTFSHRHAVLNDYINGNKWFPLDRLSTAPDRQFTVINSMLSEFAVLGFEWGYASANPHNLVMWEAQFGDFVNGAQPIIDQIISSAESKWHYANGLVVMLPHGWEGAGPEHSNAYLERFLDLSAEDNWQVIVPSTPAQWFHALRRQMHRKFRKPLISMMPKSILRDPARASNLDEFTEQSWQNVIDDPAAPVDRDAVRRLLLCSGKVYYTLRDARQMHGRSDVAIVRIEQLYPFPQKEIQAILSKYRRAEEVGWVQEEPRNRGAWSFMHMRLLGMLADNQVLAYYGRDEAASPAAGSIVVHKQEEEELVGLALELPIKKRLPSASPVAPSGADASTVSAVVEPKQPEPQPVAK